MESTTPFDLGRMFFGDDFSVLLLLEIAFRTAFMYVAALLLVRFVGKRGQGQLSPFEFLVVIAMGSAAGDPMFYPDVPLLHGVIVLGAIVLLEKGLANLTERSTMLEHAIESVPALLIRDGEVLLKALHSEGMNRDELFMKLRERGVANVADVYRAYLEPSGQLSVIRRESLPLRTDGESTLPAA